MCLLFPLSPLLLFYDFCKQALCVTYHHPYQTHKNLPNLHKTEQAQKLLGMLDKTYLQGELDS